jgi:hypothetical protein
VTVRRFGTREQETRTFDEIVDYLAGHVGHAPRD